MNAEQILSDRISKAVEILKIPEVELTGILKSLGIEKDEFSLKLLETGSIKEDDAKSPFILKGIPLARFIAAWRIINGKDPFEQDKMHFSTNVQNIHTTLNTPIGQWSNRDLLEKYGRDCPTEIEEELKKRSRERPFIIFVEEEKIDIDTSLKLLALARRQPMSSTYKVDDTIYKVYRVGEFPLEFFYECPCHPNTLLVEGYCDESGVTWIGASRESGDDDMEKMQFCRLIVNSGKLSVDENLLATLSLKELRKRSPKISLQFDELKELGQLPNLKRRLSKGTGRDPFHVVQ